MLWQFAPFKKFDADDFARFLDHLPRELDGLKLNHVIEARHASFQRRLRQAACAMRASASPITDAETWPNIADVTGDVVYARLQRGDDTLEAAYRRKELDAWAVRAKVWAKGGAPR